MRALALLAVALVWCPTGARAQRCADDPALARAAEALIARSRPPGPGDLLEAARVAGSDAPAVDGLIIRDGDRARRERFVARVAARRAAPLICGEARRGARWLVLVAPRAGRLTRSSEGALRITLAPGWTAPRIFARDGSGRTWQADARGLEVALPAELVPPIEVQLVAEGPRGPRPVAELRLGDGPERVVPDSDEPITERLAALRERRDLGVLRDNRLLARVARRHAEAVCSSRRVAHGAGDADPEERLARAGLRARHVGEVIARTQSAAHAYAALLGSPSHRAALTDPRFTDVGVGRAERDGHSCVVVLLAAWPRAVPPSVGAGVGAL